MTTFDGLKLPAALLQSLEKMNFTTPTPIQTAAIPVAIKGRDILGSAQTGTGKTAAFGIPMVMHLINNKESTALVMAPTRELAAQVLETLKKLLAHSPTIKTALLIGGDSMYKQLQQLKARPRLIVGTPGRINDHLEQGTVRMDRTDFLILDETDRMLDMGFGVQIDRILKHMPRKRQTLLFSATIPDYIKKLSDKYLNNPERIAVGSATTPIDRIRQDVMETNSADKYKHLLAELITRHGSIIIFVKTKHGADKMAIKLNKDGHSADAIHGNLNQGKRNRVIQAFRDKKNRILVATDVAARGLDIPHIEHVINYDLPQVAEDYIHRLGRTARAGAEGNAICFVTSEDRQKWRDIQRLINPGAVSSMKDEPSKKSGKSGKSRHGPRGNDPDRMPRANKSRRDDDRPRKPSRSQEFREDRQEYKFARNEARSLEKGETDREVSENRRPAASYARTNDRKPFGKKFAKPFDRDARPKRRDDDRARPRSDDRPTRRDDDRARPSRTEDRPTTRRNDDRPARRDDDRARPRSDDRPARRDDDRPKRRDDDRSERRFNDNDRGPKKTGGAKPAGGKKRWSFKDKKQSKSAPVTRPR
jgi:superfamily II DNA/RNA helicase